MNVSRLFWLFLCNYSLNLIGFAYHPVDFQSPLNVIAFGSCNDVERPQPLWAVVAENQPDLWIWCGDNIYGDSRKAAVLEKKYRQQFEQPDYAIFRRQFAIVGTWDDHDYGWNNATGTFSIKAISKTLALDFMEAPETDPRRQHEGIYGAYDFGPDGQRVKIVLLDNRYFSTDPEAEDPQLLGKIQREWLAETLEKSTAQINILVSGTQIISEEHKYEKWANFPAERDWLLDCIRKKSVPGVILISGDRHFHEISILKEADAPYPLVEVTSSGLTHSWENFEGEPNQHRVGEIFTGLGFGMLRIDWNHRPVMVTAEVRNRSNKVMNSYRILLGPEPEK